jgi:NAD(P)-dependent dehydrogenase (short-subunit alcohol dehydrogenase family)
MRPSESIAGKRCLITGATGGIGLVAARELARQGARVIIVGRNATKCAGAVERIRRDTASEHVAYLVGDLSSQHDVRRVADEYRDRYQQLDVLINNAGALYLDRRVSADGIELTFALNHLAYFLLTTLLLDLLSQSASARIINVSSEAHRRGRLDFDDLQMAQRYRGWRAYSRSKLANLYFTYELARRIGPRGITVNALHPGLVTTSFGKNNGLRAALLWAALRWIAIPPDAGAETSIFLASSPTVATTTGQYFIKCRAHRSSAISYDPVAAARLWDVSAGLVGRITDV